MKNNKKHKSVANKAKFKPGSKKRENKCIVTFDDGDRQDYLTGFHKRKVERRKVALAEIRKKIKDEQIRVREERHKEYLKMLKERTDALEEIEGDLGDTITNTTESVQYDHPNHTVTVTTISDLDLTGGHLLGPASDQANGEGEEGEKEGEKEGEEGEKEGEEEKTETSSMPRKAGNPIMNKKIRSLNSSLSSLTCKRRRKGKGKQEAPGGQERQGKERARGRQTDKRSGGDLKRRAGRTSKWQRRRKTGKKCHYQD